MTTACGASTTPTSSLLATECSVILDDGLIVADGRTVDLLNDPDLLHRHRLELPEGFDPSRVGLSR